MFVKVPRNVTEVYLGYIDEVIDEVSYLIMLAESKIDDKMFVTVFGKDEVQTKDMNKDSDDFYFEFEEREGVIVIIRVQIKDESINFSVDKQ